MVDIQCPAIPNRGNPDSADYSVCSCQDIFSCDTLGFDIDSCMEGIRPDFSKICRKKNG
jgi:hypothetical protein